MTANLPRPDDIRLVYIGSAHRAVHYATDHLPEPAPRPDQILAVGTIEELGPIGHLVLPPWCHIGTELHTTKDPARTFPAVLEHAVIFDAVLARRQRIDKAGT
jgi:hypothetical protein